LMNTVLRSLFSWTKICDSAADALNDNVNLSIETAIKNARFYERLNEAVQREIKAQLTSIQGHLQTFAEDVLGQSGQAMDIPLDSGRPAGGATDILGDALVGALKPVMAALLKELAKQLEKKAAEVAAKDAVEAAGKAAIGQGAKSAMQEGGKLTVGAGLARAAGIVTLVLVPFDIAKLVKDFKKGRENLVETVRTRYQADRPTYEMRIFDTLWPLADEAVASLLVNARELLDSKKGEQGKWLSRVQEAESCLVSLADLGTSFSVRNREKR
jgi:hypothetical protein